MERIKLLNLLAIIVIVAFPFWANSKSSDSTVKKIVARIDTTNIDNIIKDLSGENPVVVEGKEYVINNRSNLYMLGKMNPLNPIAAKYVYYKFLEYGYSPNYVEVPYHPSYPDIKLETIYAIKLGRVSPKNVIVFAASHDSYSIDSIAPGANENASGLSVVLEAARIFSKLETENTIIFVSFDDMNNTGSGASHFVDSLENAETDQIRSIYPDIIGNSGGEGTIVGSSDTVKSKNLIDDFIYISNLLDLNTIIAGITKSSSSVSFPGNNNEDVYFHRKSPPFPPFVKTKDDTFGNLELEYLHNNGRIAIGTLAYIAGVIDSTLTLQSSNPEEEIYLYPNPTESKLTVYNLWSNSSEVKINIYNTLGERVGSLEVGHLQSQTIEFTLGAIFAASS